MAIFGSNKDTQNAIDAENYYYDQASGYMSPYTENAAQDFNTGRNLVYQGGRNRLSGPRYGQKPTNYIMSPEELLQQGESGFSMNPAEQEKLKYSESLANNTLNANGMYGSENNAFIDAGIGNVLTSADMGNYLKSLDESARQELGLSNRYAKSTNKILSLFQGILGTENRASNAMASNAMRAGQEESNAYSRAADQASRFSPLNTGLQAAGTGYGIYATNRNMNDREHQMQMEEERGYEGYY